MSDPTSKSEWDSLSELERQIAVLIRNGYTTAEVVGQVGIDKDSLNECLQEVYQKLGVSDPLGLALFVAWHRPALRPSGREGTDNGLEVNAS